MQGYVATTDHDWYQHLHARPDFEEVNFWQPSGGRGFRVVRPGAPFFFKLKKPHYAIGGFGYFAHASVLPLSIAWEAFGERNGAATYAEMRARVLRYRSESVDPRSDPLIGCLMVASPTFFGPDEWVAQPADWKRNIVSGKGYDLTRGEGERIWRECLDRAQAIDLSDQPTAREREDVDPADTPRYGKAVPV